MPQCSVDEFRTRCASIRVVVSDVDGTLTDGGMYYTAEGNAMKRFSAHDGMGVTLLLQAGIEVVLLTSEQTDITSMRAAKLGIKHVFQGISDKVEALNRIMTLIGCSLVEIVYIGDDVNDIPALQLCGLCTCPADAVPEVQDIVDLVLTKDGGEGAFRELARLILSAHTQNTTT
jgi:3-deoxy-D-manno-octulosonate 8-phosphate phosphatase (KDO 8-P phosphatase)